jgi:hypothetical protein
MMIVLRQKAPDMIMALYLALIVALILSPPRGGGPKAKTRIVHWQQQPGAHHD